jgi:hypothetical protein
MRLTWRPAISYFEQRYAILRSLDDDGLLRSFRAGENQVSARLGDAAHLLILHPNGLEALVLVPEADEARVWAAVRLAFERIAPASPIRLEAQFQWLEPVDDLPYEQARHLAAERILGADAAIQGRDFALLTSGTIADVALEFTLEAGVVEAAEIPGRLARETGRVGNRRPEIPPSFWSVDKLPGVALFADSTWKREEPLDDSTMDGVSAAWEGMHDRAAREIDRIFDRYRPVTLNP